MDFVHDAMADGTQSRVLTDVDQWSRQSPLVEVGTNLAGRTAGEALDPAPEADVPRSRSPSFESSRHSTRPPAPAVEVLLTACRRKVPLGGSGQRRG
jgi:hypothetical protein